MMISHIGYHPKKKKYNEGVDGADYQVFGFIRAVPWTFDYEFRKQYIVNWAGEVVGAESFIEYEDVVDVFYSVNDMVIVYMTKDQITQEYFTDFV